MNSASSLYVDEFEKCVIAACLLDSNAITHISFLSENDFHNQDYRLLFGVIKTVYNGGEDVTPTNVYLSCERQNLDKKFPVEVLLGYSSCVSSSSEVVKHAMIVKDKAERRKIVGIGNTVKSAETDMFVSNAEILNKVQEQIDSIYDETACNISLPKETTDKIKERIDAEESGINNNIKTGFNLFDEPGGFHPDDLVCIAAYPGVGKSAYAAKIAYYMSCINDVPIAFYSLEMPNEQIVCRLCSMISHRQNMIDYTFPVLTVSQTLNNRPTRSEEQTNLFKEYLDEIGEKPLYLVDNRNSLEEIVASIGEMVRKCHVKVVFIDYLQNIQNKSKMSREEHLGECCKILKSIAKRYGICIIILTQLTQNSDKGDRRPHYYNAKGASSIYEGSDMFITIDRPEADDCDGKVSNRRYEGKFCDVSTHGTAEVKICKNKNGSTDSEIIGFHAATTDFWRLEELPIDKIGEYRSF